MKGEANTEYTFVTTNPEAEFMVWFNENGQPERIYTYTDSRTRVEDIDFKKWRVGKNPLFIHCPKSELLGVWQYLKVAAYCSEIEDD